MAPPPPSSNAMDRGDGDDDDVEAGTGRRYRTVGKLHASGLRFINGVASSYSGEYPAAALAAAGPAQAAALTPEAFDQAVDRVNNVLLMYWPCTTCFLCGYVCTPCTLGLSLGGPRACVAEAERFARFELDCLNHSAAFRAAGMRWRLRKTCLRSWIEVQLLEREEREGGEPERQLAPQAAAEATDGGDGDGRA